MISALRDTQFGCLLNFKISAKSVRIPFFLTLCPSNRFANMHLIYVPKLTRFLYFLNVLLLDKC